MQKPKGSCDIFYEIKSAKYTTTIIDQNHNLRRKFDPPLHYPHPLVSRYGNGNVSWGILSHVAVTRLISPKSPKKSSEWIQHGLPQTRETISQQVGFPPVMFWLVVWNMFFNEFPYIGNVIIPIDFHIFQRGWNDQPVLVSKKLPDNRDKSTFSPNFVTFADLRYRREAQASLDLRDGRLETPLMAACSHGHLEVTS